MQTAPVLAVDTSSERTCVALRDGSGTLHTAGSGDVVSHNEELSALVDGVLRRSGIAAPELEALLIGSGPGSFTGLRIGFSFMKGLAFGIRRRLTALSSLRAYGRHLRGMYRIIVPFADARRDELFCAVLEARDGELQPLLGPRILPPAELIACAGECARRAGIDRAQVVFVGSAPLPPGVDFPVVPPGDLAVNLIEGWSRTGGKGGEPFDVRELSGLQPDYIRPVAALTIAERRAAAGRD